MTLICLDSSVLIALEKGKITPEHLRKKFPDAHFVTTAITVFEQAYGAYILIKRGYKKKGEKILEGLREFKTYPLTAETALLAAKISAELHTKGVTIEPKDLFIATICIQNRLELLTLNVKHFQPLIEYNLTIHNAQKLD